jgi:hypothetical protein
VNHTGDVKSAQLYPQTASGWARCHRWPVHPNSHPSLHYSKSPLGPITCADMSFWTVSIRNGFQENWAENFPCFSIRITANTSSSQPVHFPFFNRRARLHCIVWWLFFLAKGRAQCWHTWAIACWWISCLSIHLIRDLKVVRFLALVLDEVMWPVCWWLICMASCYVNTEVSKFSSDNTWGSFLVCILDPEIRPVCWWPICTASCWPEVSEFSSDDCWGTPLYMYLRTLS